MTSPHRQIPDGWVKERDGSYSPPPRTAKQINSGQVGECCVTRTTFHSPKEYVDAMKELGLINEPFKASKSRTEDALNKTEKRFLEILRDRVSCHKHCPLRIQAITLVLANDCRYTPDFSVTTPERLTFYEVKGGFVREDGWIKLKTAARLYPEFTFIMAQYKGGKWTEKEIKP